MSQPLGCGMVGSGSDNVRKVFLSPVKMLLENRTGKNKNIIAQHGWLRQGYVAT